MSPIALELLVLEPKQYLDPDLDNQLISRFYYFNMGTPNFYRPSE